MTQQTADAIDYTPQTWNASQREMHEAIGLDTAMFKASCLAGGWYRRPVTIWSRINPETLQARTPSEQYQLRPADAPTPDGWTRCYTIDAHVSER